MQIQQIRPISTTGHDNPQYGKVTDLQIGFNMNTSGLTNYYSKQEINDFNGFNKYYNKYASDTTCQSAFKQSASSWKGACSYDNIRISILDAYDGKRLGISAASATPLNRVYSHSWHQYGGSDSYTKMINNLADGVHEYFGNDDNRFGANPGHINGYFTETNVNTVDRITWQLFSLTAHNATIKRLQ